MEMKNDLSSHLWWFHNRKNANTKRSSWLQSTISDLDEKTQTMLKLIEEDADSFAKRAEMYYKKRPQLINMVEEFHRAHRSLAERYDQIKYRPDQKPITSPDSLSEIYEEDRSEVSDPEQDKDTTEEPSSPRVCNDEATKLREEIERLREENMKQKEELMVKDEEKREVIRQLTLSLDLIKEENFELRKSFESESLKKNNIFLRRFFNVSPRSKPSLFGLFLFRV